MIPMAFLLTIAFWIGTIFPQISEEWLDRYARTVESGASDHFEMPVQSLKRYFDVKLFLAEKDRLAVMLEDISSRRAAMEDLGGVLPRPRQKRLKWGALVYGWTVI